MIGSPSYSSTVKQSMHSASEPLNQALANRYITICYRAGREKLGFNLIVPLPSAKRAPDANLLDVFAHLTSHGKPIHV